MERAYRVRKVLYATCLRTRLEIAQVFSIVRVHHIRSISTLEQTVTATRDSRLRRDSRATRSYAVLYR